MAIHGFNPSDWASARTEARAAIVEQARRRDKISYGDLVNRIHAIDIDPHDPRLGLLLEEISVEEARAGRGMLSALVVHKTGDMMPGPGFFDLARRLGRDTTDEVTCWVHEVSAVYASWV